MNYNSKYPFKRSTEGSGGYDIISPCAVVIKKNCTKIIETDLRLNIPIGFVGIIKSRSSLTFKHDVDIMNTGVIDSDYSGIIKIKMINHSTIDYHIGVGDKIAQILILPCFIGATQFKNKIIKPKTRGNHGFGSTGK